MHIFAYGTLADEAVQKRLTGRTFPLRPAVLPGFRLDEPAGCYRMIHPDPQAEVRGNLVDDVDEEALAIFDRWEVEGELYLRVAVTARLLDGTPVDAWAYQGMGKAVPRPEKPPGTACV